jgi:Copper type II ascorbate-dependent monooxygenase, C-terminal domain
MWTPSAALLNRVWVSALLLLAACTPSPEGGDGQKGTSLPDSVFFSEHIAPILHKHCMSCHRPGSAGPFDLITYADALRKAKTIARVTADRYMPPWPADPSYRHFAGEKVLSQLDIDLIGKWVAQGAREGDPAKFPTPPVFPEGSQFGKPDLVLRMKDAFPIAGDNRDRFLFMKIPFELPAETYVRAIEFVPGNRKLVHHMNGHLVSYEPGKKRDVFEGAWVTDRESESPQQAYPEMGLLNDDKTYPTLTPLVCSYLPGVSPATYPAGIGGYVFPRQGALLLNDMHYGPSPKDTFDQSYFNIFLGKKAPERPTMEIQLGTLGISEITPPLVIPPDTVMTFRTRAVIQNDISLLTVNPHMHLLGKSFVAYAIPPQGDTIPLIRINEWDFRWQYFYTYEYMLHLPKGSVIEVVATFDNTRDNPLNPFDPPRTIAERDGSMRTTDEMLQFILTYLPWKPGDEQIRLGE